MSDVKRFTELSIDEFMELAKLKENQFIINSTLADIATDLSKTINRDILGPIYDIVEHELRLNTLNLYIKGNFVITYVTNWCEFAMSLELLEEASDLFDLTQFKNNVKLIETDGETIIDFSREDLKECIKYIETEMNKYINEFIPDKSSALRKIYTYMKYAKDELYIVEKDLIKKA